MDKSDISKKSVMIKNRRRWKSDKTFLMILVVIVLAIFIFVIIQGRRENPAERNYIFFKNDSKENVIDSLNSFRRLIAEINLPTYKDRCFTTFNFRKEYFEINGEKIGELNFAEFKKCTLINYINEKKLQKFIRITKFIMRHNIFLSAYYHNKWELYFNYKPYEKKYNTLSYDDDLMRFLLLTHNNKVPTDFYKVLDSFENVYLVAFRSAEIWEDDVPY